MPIQVYLDFDGRFDGRTEAAHTFYRDVLGAEVTQVVRYRDSPDPGMPMLPGFADKIMHPTVRIQDTEVMASDCRNTGAPRFQDFSLTIKAQSDAEAQRLFDKLPDGGQMQLPLGQAFFASSFGVVLDRFGVSWMVHTAA